MRAISGITGMDAERFANRFIFNVKKRNKKNYFSDFFLKSALLNRSMNPSLTSTVFSSL
jgi:hypothetical protein